MSIGKVYRGLLSTTTIVQYEIDMPDLAPGDFGFALNTKTLFVGVKGKGNVKFYSNCLEEGVGGDNSPLYTFPIDIVDPSFIFYNNVFLR